MQMGEVYTRRVLRRQQHMGALGFSIGGALKAAVHSISNAVQKVAVAPISIIAPNVAKQIVGKGVNVIKATDVRNLLEKTAVAPLSVISQSAAKSLVAKDVNVIKFTDVRDTAESAAVVAGNYLAPGSSLLTAGLVSQGSQAQLASPIGVLAQVASAGFGVANILQKAAAVGVTAASGLASPAITPTVYAEAGYTGAATIAPASYGAIAGSGSEAAAWASGAGATVSNVATTGAASSLLTQGQNAIIQQGQQALMQSAGNLLTPNTPADALTPDATDAEKPATPPLDYKKLLLFVPLIGLFLSK